MYIIIHPCQITSRAKLATLAYDSFTNLLILKYLNPIFNVLRFFVSYGFQIAFLDLKKSN
jgi:hypothetical protein